MAKLPKISGRECVNALQRAGFYVRRQRGSHIIMRQDDPFAQVVVPEHRILDRGTLRGIIRQAGVSVEEFVGFL
jgi:predicted RNA binding protein YcfA (HicA-like mRNA interferase family)